MGDLDDQLRRLAQQRADRVPETSATSAMEASANQGNRLWWLAAAATVVVLVGTAWLVAADDGPGADVAGTTSTTPSSPPSTTVGPSSTRPQPQPEEPLRTFTSEFGVTFDVPDSWVEVEDGRTLSGETGWVAIERAPDGTIDNAADEVLASAGEMVPSPSRSSIDIAGQPAAVVSGSRPVENEDFGLHRVAFAVIALPLPVEVDGELMTNIFVGGSADSLSAILGSLRWNVHPCGGSNEFAPATVSLGDIEVDDDVLGVRVGVTTDGLYVQGALLSGWTTVRTSLEDWSPISAGRIDEIQLGRHDDLAPNEFELQLPGEGGVGVRFDGCELTVIYGYDE